MIDRDAVRDAVRDLYADALDSYYMGEAYDLWDDPADRVKLAVDIIHFREAFRLLGGRPADIDHLPDMISRRYADA